MPQFINISNSRSTVEPASMPEFTVKNINLPQNNKGAAGNEEADLGQTNPTFRERNEKHAILSSNSQAVGPIRIEHNEESIDQQQNIHESTTT